MERIANKFGYSKEQIERAIHAVKNEAHLRGKDVAEVEQADAESAAAEAAWETQQRLLQ